MQPHLKKSRKTYRGIARGTTTQSLSSRRQLVQGRSVRVTSQRTLRARHRRQAFEALFLDECLKITIPGILGRGAVFGWIFP